MPTLNDPEAFRKAATPRPLAEVEAALKTFDEELYELRNRHGIAQIQYTAVAAVDRGGKVGAQMVVGHIGDSEDAVLMSTYALAHWRKSRDKAEAEQAGLALAEGA